MSTLDYVRLLGPFPKTSLKTLISSAGIPAPPKRCPRVRLSHDDGAPRGELSPTPSQPLPERPEDQQRKRDREQLERAFPKIER
jgi:hypothetical protein